MENLYNYITLAAPTTTAISTAPVILSGIIINKRTANGVITVYDGVDTTTGTTIAVITSPATLLDSCVSIDFHDIWLKKGLTIVTSGAAQDITVAYRSAN